ncbi:MAG: DUF2933 domain-containing protein [Rhodospirillales bacterium]|nr:DUF2933 domain-containing protein [Rhodospirillales bacterium]
MIHADHPTGRSFFSSRGNLVLLGFLLIGGYFLVTEHRAHLALAVPFLPWLLLLACPLMHLFMHHGDEGSGNGGHGQPRDTPPAHPH